MPFSHCRPLAIAVALHWNPFPLDVRDRPLLVPIPYLPLQRYYSLACIRLGSSWSATLAFRERRFSIPIFPRFQSECTTVWLAFYLPRFRLFLHTHHPLYMYHMQLCLSGSCLPWLSSPLTLTHGSCRGGSSFWLALSHVHSILTDVTPVGSRLIVSVPIFGFPLLRLCRILSSCAASAFTLLILIPLCLCRGTCIWLTTFHHVYPLLFDVPPVGFRSIVPVPIFGSGLLHLFGTLRDRGSKISFPFLHLFCPLLRRSRPFKYFVPVLAILTSNDTRSAADCL